MSTLNPVHHLRAVEEIFSILRKQRELLFELTRRELTEKYAGQVLGALWTIGHPMILMGVYVFLFSVVFRTKLEDRGLAVASDYTVYILSGLIPWLMFQESIVKSSQVIVSNSNLVKQVVFPIEVLPVKVVFASITTMLLLLTLLFIYILARFQLVYWGFALVPALIVFQVLAMVGAAFALSAVGCFFRDLRELAAIFGMVNIYLMPVVYLPDWVPSIVRPLIYANPFSYMIWCYQDALTGRGIQHPWAWLVFPVSSVMTFVVGYRLFRKVKPYFGNVL